MAKKVATEAIVSVYFDYDWGGGGMPFGHARDLHVEVSRRGAKTIARTANEAEVLLRKVNSMGKLVGRRKSLPYSKDWSSRSYKQKYELPKGLVLTK